MARIDDRLLTLDAAASQFRHQQTEFGGSVSVEDKTKLNGLYRELEAELDDFLAAEYGVKKGAITKWKRDTKPFHWFCDFHSIVQAGGFDLIIGNPPYVEYAKVKGVYSLTSEYDPFLGNLYAACAYRSNALLSSKSYCSLIVPVSLPSTDRMEELRAVLKKDHTPSSQLQHPPTKAL